MRKLFFILITLLFFTSTASAETMYLKEEIWSCADSGLLSEIATAELSGAVINLEISGLHNYDNNAYFDTNGIYAATILY